MLDIAAFFSVKNILWKFDTTKLSHNFTHLFSTYLTQRNRHETHMYVSQKSVRKKTSIETCDRKREKEKLRKFSVTQTVPKIIQSKSVN